VDAGTTPYPVPLGAQAPLGSLVYDPSVSATIGFAGDTDSFTINVDPGQTVTVLVHPTAAGLQPTVTLTPPSGPPSSPTAPAAGQDAVLQTVPAVVGGIYTITVGGVGTTTGGYTAQVILNAAQEAEGHGGPANNSPLTAQNIDASAVSLGGSASRLAV